MNSKFFALSALCSGLVLSSNAQLVFSNITTVVTSTANLQAVAVGGAGTGAFVVVGDNSSVSARTLDANLASGDLFATGMWSAASVPSNGYALKAVTFGNGSFAAVGSNNVVFASANNGSNWGFASKVFANGVEVDGLAFAGNVFVAAPASPQISRSPGGALTNWSIATNASLYTYSFLESFRAVAPLGPNIFVAVGIQGVIRRSADGGQNWTNVTYLSSTITQPNLLGVASDNANTFVAVGTTGIILTSTDGGVTWATNGPPQLANRVLSAVSFMNPGFIAVGSDNGTNGLVLTSLDGSSWATNSSLAVPVSRNLRGVSFATGGTLKDVGLVVGEQGTVLLGGYLPLPPVGQGDRTNCVGYYTNTWCASNASYLTVDWFATATRTGPGEAALPNGKGVKCFSSADPAYRTRGPHTLYAESRDLRTGFYSTTRTPVTVWIDPEPPKAVFTARTNYLDAAGSTSITAADVGSASTDNCEITNMVASPTTFGCANVGPNTVTLTVTDSAGNQTTTNGTVTIVDNIPPVPNCPANITKTNDLGQCSALLAFAANPTDNCGVASTNYSAYGTNITSPHVFPVGMTTVNVMVTDIHGNTNGCSFTVTVNDTEKPAPNCPANITQTNDLGQCSASVLFAANPTDNCGVLSTVYQTNGVAITSPWVFPVGTTTVDVTVADIHGNTNSCSFTVTVNDTEKPATHCPANITTTNEFGLCSASVAFAAAPTDNCGVASTGYKTNGVTITSPHVFPVGTTTVDVTVTDIHGNTNNCSFTVTVNDMELPVVNCPANITKANDPGLCSASVAFAATSTDNCGVLSTVYQTNGVTITSPWVFLVGTTTVDVAVADIHGNTNYCSFSVTVNDTEKPVPHCPANITQNNDLGLCSALVTFAAAPTDNCGVASTVYTNNGGAITSPWVFPVGTNTVNVTVTDIHGNTASCNFTVRVRDTEPPTISCPTNLVFAANPGQCYRSAVTFPITVADNCGAVNFVSSPASGSTFQVGVTTVTNTATDTAGNTSVCTFTVTVYDTELPVVNCPANITKTNAPGLCSASVAFAAAPTDNCGVASTNYSVNGTNITSPHVFPVGTNLVDVAVTDVHSNSSTCSFTVTVLDKEPPTLICPANMVLQVDAGGCSRSNVNFTFTASDNCTPVTVVSAPQSGATFPGGTTIVTATATDTYGNSSECSFTVTVYDPTVGATIINESLHVLQGGQVAIPLALQGTSPWTVVWSDGTTNIYSSNSVTRLVSSSEIGNGNPGATTNYSVVSVQDTNCFGLATGSIQVDVLATDTIALISSDNSICPGECPTLTVTLKQWTAHNNGNNAWTGTYGSPWTVIWSTGLNNNGTNYVSPIPGTNAITVASPNSFGLTNITVCPTTNENYRIRSVIGTIISGNGPAPATNSVSLSGVDRVETITVNPRPTGYLVSGTTTICAGSSTSIHLADTDLGIAYTLLGAIPVQTTNGTGNPVNFTVAPASNTTYTVIASNTITSCTTNLNGSATVTVNPLAVGGTAIPAASSVPNGGTTNLAVTGYVGSIQWQQSATGSNAWSNVSGGSGATTANYTTPVLSNTTYYRALAATTCSTNSSTVATVVVIGPLTLDTTTNAPGSVILSWPGIGDWLESSGNVTGPWTNVNQGNSPPNYWTNPISGGLQLFRLRSPVTLP